MRKTVFLLVFISVNQAFAQVQLDSVTIRGNCIQWCKNERPADVNNILNTQYKEIGAIPMPGRWYAIGAHFEMP